MITGCDNKKPKLGQAYYESYGEEDSYYDSYSGDFDDASAEPAAPTPEASPPTSRSNEEILKEAKEKALQDLGL